MEDQKKKLLKLAGDKNRFQYIYLMIFLLSWALFNMLGIVLNFFETKQTVTFYSKTEGKNITKEIDDEICALQKNEYSVVETNKFSLVIDLDIQCDKMKISLIGTLCSVGYLIGALSYSYILNFFGEKKTLVIMNIIFIIPYVVALFFMNYWYLLVIIIITMPLLNVICYTTSTLMTEFITLDAKSFFTAVINCGNPFGGLVYILFIYIFKDWKKVFICQIVCLLIMLLLYLVLIRNSFSYYLKNKDYDGYLNLLKFIAKINGKLKYFEEQINTPEYQDILLQIKEGKPKPKEMQVILTTKESEKQLDQPQVLEHSNIEEKNVPIEGTPKEIPTTPITLANLEPEQIPATPMTIANADPMQIDKKLEKKNLIKSEEKAGLISLLKYKSVRGTFLIFCICWMFTSFLNSGSVIGLKNLKGSIYVNSSLLFICEAPAYFISGFLMNIKCLGRKYFLIIMTIGFATMNLTSYIFFNNNIIILVCYLANRYFVMSCFCVYYTYCYESYPMSIAKLAYGINGASNNLGGIIVPFIIEYINDRTRFLLFAICGFGCSGLMTLLDETIGKPIPEEIKEISQRNNKEIDIKSIVV